MAALDPEAAQAFLEHYGNWATLGHLPQIQAAAEVPMARAMDRINGTNVANELPGYVERRDANRHRLSTQEDMHPRAAVAGKALGGAAALLGAGRTVLKPVPSWDLLSDALRVGAAGAAVNPGDRDGEVNPVQAEERGKNALKALGVRSAWEFLRR